MPIELGSFSLGAVAGSAVGGIIGHLLTGVRDKKARDAKDFNEVAGPIAEILRKERRFPTPGSKIDFANFRRVLSNGELRRFDKTVEEYEKAKEEEKDNVYAPVDFTIGEEGRFMNTDRYYHDSSSIKAAIDRLLKFTERK